MNNPAVANLEHDPRFPSGAWTGFYLQQIRPGRNKTDTVITWSSGKFTGSGKDRVGPYTVNGTYDLATGRCEWIKQYLGKHSVAYRGINDGHGIWGVWEIRALGGLFVDRGGFHLWPEGTDVSEETDRTEQAVLSLMRQEFGSGVSPLRLLPTILTFAIILGMAAAAVTLWLGTRY
jgi:hypothetical protein